MNPVNSQGIKKGIRNKKEKKRNHKNKNEQQIQKKKEVQIKETIKKESIQNTCKIQKKANPGGLGLEKHIQVRTQAWRIKGDKIPEILNEKDVQNETSEHLG